MTKKECLPVTSDGVVMYPGTRVYWWDMYAKTVLSTCVRSVELKGKFTLNLLGGTPHEISTGKVPVFADKTHAQNWRRSQLQMELDQLPPETE